MAPNFLHVFFVSFALYHFRIFALIFRFISYLWCSLLKHIFISIVNHIKRIIIRCNSNKFLKVCWFFHYFFDFYQITIKCLNISQFYLWFWNEILVTFIRYVYLTFFFRSAFLSFVKVEFVHWIGRHHHQCGWCLMLAYNFLFPCLWIIEFLSLIHKRNKMLIWPNKRYIFLNKNPLM